ncbi:MAG: LysM peptidoglycan-binding domain-containing protein [Clostridia bacterium]|nr:LysM peptidoglycan-binding domain-containing protein [Clostridia bacterium]
MKKTTKKYRIKSKFRFIMFVVIVLGLAAGTFGYVTGNDVSTALEQPGDQITVEVTAGDTVWDIAKHFAGNDTDIRKAVYEICEANDLQDAQIHSGMTLTIPENL